MKSLASILVVLFSIITASTIVSCDSKPSTANSYANEDVYIAKAIKRSNIRYVADMAFMQDILVTDVVEQERLWLIM